ncbi:MAG: winged helix-turn-helix domain-containing protein [Cyanobacteriota bacterium]|jgi:two-component system phosphate regulon response regulator PhoB
MLSLDVPQYASAQKLNQTYRILVVEDEEVIRQMLVLALQEEGYDVLWAEDGRSALALIQDIEAVSNQPPIDLMLLDLMLPQVNGLDICRTLRYQGNTLPILIVSAKASETDRVLGLEVGADDYLSKPFSMRELVARCRALIRRQSFGAGSTNTFRKFRDLVLYPKECRVVLRGEEVNLAPKEYRLLELFMTHPRRVWSREQLIEQVWGMDFLGDTKTVDVHIRWLREKLELDPSQPEYIITVRGFGYRFG